MAMQPSILVILVAYQSAEVLPACLAALQAQQGVALRVVVVDNGSTDDSAGVAERLRGMAADGAAAGMTGGMAVIRAGANLGFAKGCNRGWREGRGAFAFEYVLYLNPDTRLEDSELLAALCSTMEATPKVAIATPRLVLEDGSIDQACRRGFPTLWSGLGRVSGLDRWPLVGRLFGGYNLRHLPAEGEYAVPCVTGAFMLCRAALVEAVGGFDERYFMYIEDIELCWQAAERGQTTLYVGSRTARHLKGHASRSVSDAMLAELFKSTRLWFELHRYPQYGLLRRAAARAGLWWWEKLARWKNRWRGRKSAQP